MPDLATDLRTYLDAVAERFDEDTDLRDAPRLTPIGTEPDHRRAVRTTWPPRLAVAAGIGLLVLLTGALVVMNDRDSDEADPTRRDLTERERELLELAALRVEDLDAGDAFDWVDNHWSARSPDVIETIRPREIGGFQFRFLSCATDRTFAYEEGLLTSERSQVFVDDGSMSAVDTVFVYADEQAAQRAVDAFGADTDRFRRCLEDVAVELGPYGVNEATGDLSLIDVTNDPGERAPGTAWIQSEFPEEVIGGHDHNHGVEAVATRIGTVVVLFGIEMNSQSLEMSTDRRAPATIDSVMARLTGQTNTTLVRPVD
jgi:hypothetical protein